MSAALRVGYAGLGAIGLPMAQRLADAGVDLAVWNRSPGRAQPLIAAGAREAATPADLARAVDVLCLCVTDEAATEAVVFGARGIASAGHAGLVVVDHSTVHPVATQRLAARLQAAGGGRWVDAPVSGGPAGARKGTLAVFAGGAAADVERARPVLMHYAGKLTHLGPAGSGQAAKACNQIVSFGTAAALAESLHLAKRFGLDVARLPQALEGGFADSAVLRHYAPQMLNGEFIGSTLNALKDMEIALDLGRETQTPMPVVGLLTSLYRLLVTQGHTKLGLGGLMRVYVDGPLVGNQAADGDGGRTARFTSP